MDKIPFKEILSWIGGVSVIVLAVLGIIKLVLIELVKVKFGSKENKKLEELKGEIGKYNSSLGSITQAYLHNYHKVQDKRIEAAEALWQAILKIKYGVPYDLAFAVRAYNYEALQNAAKQQVDDIVHRIKAVDMVGFQNMIHDTAKELEKFRPFISDRVFLSFEAYASLVNTYFYLIFDGMRKESITFWKEDFNIRTYAVMLTKEEQMDLIYIKGQNNFLILQIVVEKNIVAELRNSIEGVNMSVDTSAYIKGANDILMSKDNK